MSYKTICAVMLIGAFVGLAPIAHADDDADYINNLKQHGLSPGPGTSESQWEAGAIKAAHDICGMAAAGYSRDGITARYAARNPDSGDTVKVTVDAAVATYCPRYW
jgi:Protein of unknown function (DUF732)